MDAEATVNEFIRRVVGGDHAGAGELVADDVEYDNVPVGKNLGRDALITFLGSMTRGIDRIEFETHRQTCTGDVVMNERTDRFHIGDQVVEIPVAGVFEIGADGRIALWRDYFDVKMFTDQMAAVTKG
jgi:limonene-1,2-epoxide hydrolase